MTLLGNNDGTFQPPAPVSAGDGPKAVATADFNLDANPDLVVVNQFSGDVLVALGNGDGTFRSPVNSAVGQYPCRSR